MRAFSVYSNGGYFAAEVQGRLTVTASPVAGHGLRSEGSLVVVQGLRCSEACGIFLNQGSNPYPLHWQADS